MTQSNKDLKRTFINQFFRDLSTVLTIYISVSLLFWALTGLLLP